MHLAIVFLDPTLPMALLMEGVIPIGGRGGMAVNGEGGGGCLCTRLMRKMLPGVWVCEGDGEREVL